jgi:hypothetical protein
MCENNRLVGRERLGPSGLQVIGIVDENALEPEHSRELSVRNIR